MTTFLQPRELTAEELEALIDGEPFLPDDPDGAKFQAAMEKAARDAAILQQAEAMLLYRETVRVADRLEKERSGAENSWAPVDLESLFDTKQETPTVGEFHRSETSNGGGVFYRGKVNEIHGPSESGKTMVLLHVVAQEIRAGRHAAMIDFEDGGQAIVNRLRWIFGLTREEIVKQFHYFRPETAFGEAGYAALGEIPELSIVVIDAVTESMSVAGLDGRNENEVAAWYNDFPKRVARLECAPAVVIVDHTPQGDHGRQIGSQHKKSAIDGVSYTAKPIAPFVKGGAGSLQLKVAKDKPGGVRPDALPDADGGQFHRGTFKIDGRADENNPKVRLYGVEPADLHPGAGTGASPVDVQLPSAALAPTLVALSDDGSWMAVGDLGRLLGRLTRDEQALVRANANRLVKTGLADKKDFGGTVKFKINQRGMHSSNAWLNEARKDRQTMIE